MYMKIFRITNKKSTWNSSLQLFLLSSLVSIAPMMPSVSNANVLNGPTYDVEKLGPFTVSNPDINGATKCANLSTPMPGGFPYASLAGVYSIALGGGGALEIANATTTRCYSARMFVYVPKDVPTNKHPALLMLHGTSNAIPTPGVVDDTYAKRLASQGIVVAYFDFPPLTLSNDVAVPSIRMSGVTNKYLPTVLDNPFSILGFVGLTANSESMLVAYDWLVQNADNYGIDTNAIGTFGDSVGGVIAQSNYGLSSANVVPAGFKYVIATRPCYALQSHFTGPSLTLCNSLPNYVDTPLVGPPLLAWSGVQDTTFPPPFEDDFVRTIQKNGIPVEYQRLNAVHDAFVRYLDGKLVDRQIQFIYAATKNEGCVNSHSTKAGKSACHLAGFQEEILDNSSGSYASCLNPENRVTLNGHTYALCSGYGADQWPRSYNDAKTLCESNGGYLVKLTSNVNDPENQLVKNWRNDNSFELNPWVDPSLLASSCYSLSSTGTIGTNTCSNPRPFVCEFDQ